MEKNNDIENISKANSIMLDYFNHNYDQLMDSIQILKTKLFECNIKIEELTKTKSLYVFNSNSRKNVFSPIISDASGNEKEEALNAEMTNLQITKASLETKIAEQEIEIRDIRKKIKILNSAELSISSLKNELSNLYDEMESIENEGFDFVEDSTINSDAVHGTNILMLDAFEKTYMGTMLDKKIKSALTSNVNTLKTLLISSNSETPDIKQSINNVIINCNNSLALLNFLLEKLNYNIDTSKPLYTLIDNFLTEKRDLHQEFVIESSIDCNDKEKSISYIKSLSLISLLNIFFDNIFKHSNGNRVTFSVYISDTIIDVSICDNGIGINTDYYSESAWYSSLHKAHEIIYLLKGNLSILGENEKGTSVKFSFSTL